MKRLHVNIGNNASANMDNEYPSNGNGHLQFSNHVLGKRDRPEIDNIEEVEHNLK